MGFVRSLPRHQAMSQGQGRQMVAIMVHTGIYWLSPVRGVVVMGPGNASGGCVVKSVRLGRERALVRHRCVVVRIALPRIACYSSPSCGTPSWEVVFIWYCSNLLTPGDAIAMRPGALLALLALPALLARLAPHAIAMRPRATRRVSTITATAQATCMTAVSTRLLRLLPPPSSRRGVVPPSSMPDR